MRVNFLRSRSRLRLSPPLVRFVRWSDIAFGFALGVLAVRLLIGG